jgi:predicted GNAT family acetyltransferase
MEQTIRVNNSLKRFELEVKGSIAYIDYKLSHQLLFLIHTEVPAALRGTGVGSLIVQKALEYAKENDYKIVPICPFVQSYLKRHPEWKQVEAPDAARFLNKKY